MKAQKMPQARNHGCHSRRCSVSVRTGSCGCSGREKELSHNLGCRVRLLIALAYVFLISFLPAAAGPCVPGHGRLQPGGAVKIKRIVRLTVALVHQADGLSVPKAESGRFSQQRLLLWIQCHHCTLFVHTAAEVLLSVMIGVCVSFVSLIVMSCHVVSCEKESKEEDRVKQKRAGARNVISFFLTAS